MGEEAAGLSELVVSVQGSWIDHVAIATPDADELAAWFENSLGLVVVGDELVEGPQVRLVYLAGQYGGRDRQTVLQLAQPTGPGRVQEFVAIHGQGLHHICFSIPNIRGVLDGMGQSHETIFAGGRGQEACFFDQPPAGTAIELTEPVELLADLV